MLYASNLSFRARKDTRMRVFSFLRANLCVETKAGGGLPPAFEVKTG